MSVAFLSFFQWIYLCAAIVFLIAGNAVGLFGSLILSTLFTLEAARRRRGGES